jgi:S-adenosylmethionine synthetase
MRSTMNDFKVADLTPYGFIKDLDLIRPVYRPPAAYGHFGRDGEGFTWEQTTKADILRNES